jgi:hypothetical protein
MSEYQEKRGPGRPRKDFSADEEHAVVSPVKAARRRRDADSLRGVRMRLSVNEDKLDRENFEYRFIKDDPTRLHQMTVQDDWDIVQDRNGEIQAKHEGQGAEIAHGSGTRDASGHPERLVLVQKPKSYYNDDAAAKQRKIDETENAMRQGPGGEQSYTPDGRNAVMEVSVDK